MARSGYWNPNVHYQPVILGPAAAARALPAAHAVSLLAAVDQAAGLVADVGGRAAGDADELAERGREHRVRMPGRRPDLVVLVQPGVDQGADLGRVADRGHAADGLAGPFPDRTG